MVAEKTTHVPTEFGFEIQRRKNSLCNDIFFEARQIVLFKISKNLVCVNGSFFIPVDFEFSQLRNGRKNVKRLAALRRKAGVGL